MLAAQISSTIEFLSRPVEQGLVQLRLFNYPHAGRIVLTDRVAYFTPYRRDAHSRDCRVIKYRRGGEMYDHLSRLFGMLWYSATLVATTMSPSRIEPGRSPPATPTKSTRWGWNAWMTRSHCNAVTALPSPIRAMVTCQVHSPSCDRPGLVLRSSTRWGWMHALEELADRLVLEAKRRQDHSGSLCARHPVPSVHQPSTAIFMPKR